MTSVAKFRPARGPQIRATFVKSALESFADFDPVAREQVLAQLDVAAKARIEVASRASWLSGEELIFLDIALHRELGDEGVVAFWRRFTRRATRSPLLRPIAEGVMRLLGGPPSAFRLLPKAWAMVSRDFGRIECRVQEGQRTLIAYMLEIPALSRPELFSLGQRGSYQGILDLVGAKGSVNVEDYRPDLGRYSYRVEWE